MVKKKCYIVANFGGPRDLDEIPTFLEALLTDRDVIRSKMPNFLHNYLFRRVAKKRAIKIAEDYKKIGGRSPIFEDTEAVAAHIRQATNSTVIPFHRYLPETHALFVKTVQETPCHEIQVFPMFPQFTYATTGSIARWFQKNLPHPTVNKMRWIKSYAAHPSYIKAQQQIIAKFLEQNNLKHEETILLFSAHGLPQDFVDSGDIYESECRASFQHVMQAFPKILGRLSYQSKFGPGEWLKPYTDEACQEIFSWNEGRKNVVFVPISFTSDHIETLFEVQELYLPIITDQGLKGYRVPALTLDPTWINAILDILQETNLCNTQMLIRKKG